jgi:hypothetical protein
VTPRPPLKPTTDRVTRVRLLWDGQHHDELVEGVIAAARVSLWIATANIKAVMIQAPVGTVARARGRYMPIAERFAELVRRGVEIRLLHSTPASRPFRQSLAKLEVLKPPRFETRVCPRSHLKLIAVDGRHLYVGSANLTGAGLGAKSAERRNFEAGFLTDDDVFLDAAQARFERIWSGAECRICRLRAQCPQPLDSA